MNKIYIKWGSDKDFDNLTQELEDVFTLQKILSYIDIRQIEIKGIEPTEEEKVYVKNLVISTNDYGTVSEWALLGFSNSILKNHKVEIENLYLSNPPTKIYEDIKKSYNEGIICEIKVEHIPIIEEDIKYFVDEYNSVILGQKDVPKLIAPTLYSAKYKKMNKPIVILFLGKSGVGKTETAKFMHECFSKKGELLRVQFSMQQTEKSANFIFGSKQGEDSLARRLISRTSDIVLFDEFDKVNQVFYNAFYQMFDEGLFVDTNYSVDVSDCIIVCTSNFLNENDAEKYLGTPIYSRFSKIINFKDISNEDRCIIAENVYNKAVKKLDESDKHCIKNNDVLEFYIDSINKGHCKNIRAMTTDIENAIYYEILKVKKII